MLRVRAELRLSRKEPADSSLEQPLVPPSATAHEAARLFKRLAQQALPGRILDVRIFGSMARGDDGPDSDLDLLFLVDERDMVLEDEIFRLLYQVYEAFDYPFVISPRIMSAAHFNELLTLERAFARNVLAEGVAV